MTIEQVAQVLQAHNVEHEIRGTDICLKVGDCMYELFTLNGHWVATGHPHWYTYRTLASDALSDMAEVEQCTMNDNNLDSAIEELARLETKERND